MTEGIGEDIIPSCVDFDVIDHFEKVTDKDGMVMTRELALKEGIFVGNSAGCAIQGLNQLRDRLKPEDLVVVVFHDHGSRYVGKIFNDDWMRDRGYLDKGRISVSELQSPELIKADVNDPVSEVVKVITENGISQVPVFDNGTPVGAITESRLFNELFNNPDIKTCKAGDVMQESFTVVEGTMTVTDVAEKFGKKTPAVLYKNGDGNYHILTKHDIIKAIAD